MSKIIRASVQTGATQSSKSGSCIRGTVLYEVHTQQQPGPDRHCRQVWLPMYGMSDMVQASPEIASVHYAAKGLM